MTGLRVAFQGEFAAFSEDAARVLWPGATTVPLHSVSDVLRAVSSGEVDAGVLPVENSVAGSVAATHDALAGAADLHVVAETVLRINQCLLAPSGTSLANIRAVESHPIALAQCSIFLGGLANVRQLTAPNTATAARSVADAGDFTRAAVAGRGAAERYGLTVLAEHIEDRPDNQTRFLGISRTPANLHTGTSARTSCLFSTPDAPGALLRALEPLAIHGLNLSKLESRPTGKPWTYRFFADIDHEAREPRLALALDLMRKVTLTCRVLGTYARAPDVPSPDRSARVRR